MYSRREKDQGRGEGGKEEKAAVVAAMASEELSAMKLAKEKRKAPVEYGKQYKNKQVQ